MLELTEHFCKRWRDYFRKDPPAPEAIFRIINKAVWLQKYKLLYDGEGVPFRVLGMYWDPDRGIIIKVDWDTNKVVTMITPESKQKKNCRS